MSKLCCNDVLRWSRDIHIEHLSGIRKYDTTGRNNDRSRPEEIESEDPELLSFVRPNPTQQVPNITQDEDQPNQEELGPANGHQDTTEHDHV
ncbi:hypothetical protein AVEN_87600-1 [Araneus ventricosus]|uniref:Uncharacterized protein n=1 Tax=Araneus ventricosus TaxID=182803 RepID=A0A4Y2LR17_ARAVE|nr:hypothetical protein AVEN_87600-1 [Araneus ventricosus]